MHCFIIPACLSTAAGCLAAHSFRHYAWPETAWRLLPFCHLPAAYFATGMTMTCWAGWLKSMAGILLLEGSSRPSRQHVALKHLLPTYLQNLSTWQAGIRRLLEGTYCQPTHAKHADSWRLPKSFKLHKMADVWQNKLVWFCACHSMTKQEAFA